LLAKVAIIFQIAMKNAKKKHQEVHFAFICQEEESGKHHTFR